MVKMKNIKDKLTKKLNLKKKFKLAKKLNKKKKYQKKKMLG